MSTTIEATCTTCGTINRVGEADVPAGAKFVPCISCKSRVALPPMKASRPPPLPGGPPKGAGSPIGLSDLPAPKRQSPLSGAEPSRPAPRSAISEIDLLAPKARQSAPVTTSGTFDLDDLLPDTSAEFPAPKSRAADVSDLPAPRGSAPRSRAHETPTQSSVSDLPTPSAKAPPSRPFAPATGVGDLPTPKGRMPSISDLPAPVRSPAISDLPAPRAGVADLPTPRSGGVANLPAPRTAGVADLPMPKQGGIIDLPTPKSGGIADVPAPKGFFDDLPQPARNPPSQSKGPDLPAPKGFCDDFPGRVSSNKPEVPAPKGYFDDLPGRVNAQKAAAAAAPEVPAPKGFFDDLPGRVNAQKAAAAAAPEVPAPKGYFDDLPGRAHSQANAPAPVGFFDDLPQPSRSESVAPLSQRPANLPFGLSMDANAPALELDLGLDSSQAHKYDDLDLSMPSTGIKIDAPKPHPLGNRPNPPASPLPSFRRDQGPPATLELEEPRNVVVPTTKLGPKRKSDPVDPEFARARSRRLRLIGLAGLVVLMIGSGGFYFYSRWAAKRAVETTIFEELTKAKDALSKSDREHWDRAAGAASLVLEANSKHAEALAIAAEARLASALANGQSYGGKLSQARQHIQVAVSENIAGPNLIRAQALNAITNGVGDRAVELLKGVSGPDSKDGQTLLYLGWAYAAAADPTTAIKTYDAAIANSTDYVKTCALYGRGLAKLDQADLPGADADFKAVAALDKDHLGAQVGQAAAMPASQSQQQEKDLLALFERKDFAGGDPRVVVKAWSLAAEAAKRGGRLDAARERYRNALQVLPDDLGALAGAAEVELRDGKLDAASDQIAKALAISKDDVRSQLVQSEISIAKNDLPDARARIEVLGNRNPPPPKLDQARIKMAAGRLAEAAGKDEDAAELYGQAAELAGDTDLAPTLAAVAKYTGLADKSDDQAKATELRGKATKLLAKLETQADKDPAIALALGAAYLRAGDAAKAEPWLRKFNEARADDAEGQFQMAKALAKLDKIDDAITRFNRAIELAPKRPELMIELARTYERAAKDDQAGEIYNKLLAAAKDPSVEIRAGAGRFFARRGEKEKAGEQGEAILKVVPNHTAGMFLKAEGLLVKNQLDDARLLFGKAVAAERDAQYFDGLGRANEAKAVGSNEVKFQQAALDAYKTASSIDPKLFNPHAGTGRLLVSRKEYVQAIEPLRAANVLDQTNADVVFLVGKCFYELRTGTPAQAANAILWFTRANALQETGDAHFYLGNLYYEKETGDKGAAAVREFDLATAIADKVEKATGKVPEWYLDAQYLRGRVYGQLGNVPAARAAWLRYKERATPSTDQARYNEVSQALVTSLKGP